MNSKIFQFALVLSANVAACANHVSADEAIRVAMRSTHISVSRPEVSVGDVCTIDGGTRELRNQISKLDLETLVPGRATTISRKQVAVRVALAGISDRSIKSVGPDLAIVNLVREEDLQYRLEKKIQADLGRQFGIPTEDVRVALLDSNSLELIREQIDTTNFNVMTFFDSRVPIGEKYIQVDIADTAGNRINRKFHVNFVIMRDVFVTSKYVPKGNVIGKEHVQVIKRPLSESTIDPVGFDCIGCIARRDIPAHEVVTSRYVGRRPTSVDVGVKRNDLVDIVVRHGPLTVRVKNAKVMTGGNKGQVVRVLNTKSNQQINAVVVDQSTVMVRN